MSRNSVRILESPEGSRSSGEWSGSGSSAQCSVRLVMQAVARAGNHTCIELSSALSTRTRFGPFSAAMPTTSSSSRRRSCRGAIAALHAPAEFCFYSMLEGCKDSARGH
eukprot:scaffold16056_cov132-Isochrysis_galbana.AAC.5